MPAPEFPTPTTEAGRAGLAALLAEPQASLAALDYDGTLSTIAQRPEDATPAPGAFEAVGALAERVGAVVLISGRPAGQLLELTGLRTHPARHLITVLAQYGLERWDGNTDQLSSPPALPGVEGAREELAALLADPHTPQGVSIEDKGQALVVHTRLTADPDGALGALRPRLDAIAKQAGLEPHPARNALELRPPGYEKGGALLRFTSERASKMVLFVGDDLGDLPAFDALDQLRAQGIAGLGVVSDSAEVTGLRERADLLLDGPPAVVAFLRELAARLR
ncbi:MAG TPA: trehalose-phosphatase [Frankiaceae bacterium]|jgi:trehalose 6-phosphate phosphatase|nr:trehalose-phosphatase [Frankiaceae bacterium]